MARPKAKRPPSYRHHKARNLAAVTIDGKDHYLGRYGSPESYEQYARLIAERSVRVTPDETLPTSNSSPVKLTIGELTLRYWKYCEDYYRPNNRAAAIKAAMRAVNGCYASLPAAQFGPLKLQLVRQQLIDGGGGRRYINDLVNTIVRMFRWAVAQELLPVDVHQALKTVEALKAGRSSASEPRHVPPVPVDSVRATLPHLSPVTGAMVRLQLLTGARPSEIRQIRPCDITIQEDDVWCYRPASHKNTHRGHERRVYIGPQGQAILRPWLERDPTAYCFSPGESERLRRAKQRAAAREPRRRRLQSTDRQFGDHYSKDGYARAISRAAEKAGVPHWAPNQLRHTRATELREKYGIEAAQLVLGHQDAAITQVYAEQPHTWAASIAKEAG